MTGTQTQTWTTGVTTIALLVLRTGELKSRILCYNFALRVVLQPQLSRFWRNAVQDDAYECHKGNFLMIMFISKGLD